MNISGFKGFAGGSNPSVGRQPTEQPARHPVRQREAAAPPTSNAPATARQRTYDARPLLDHSDAALTRRDIPRGSIVDILA